MQRRNFFKALLGIAGTAAIIKDVKTVEAYNTIGLAVPQMQEVCNMSHPINIGDIVKYRNDFFVVDGFNSGAYERSSINACGFWKLKNNTYETDRIIFQDWKYDEDSKIKRVIERNVSRFIERYEVNNNGT